MKFTINKNEIESGLNKLSGMLGYNLLSNFKLTTDFNNLIISASDYENAGQITIPAIIEDQGEILLSGKRLMDICSKVLSENIIFEMKDDKINIKGDGKKSAKYTIPYMIDDTFPAFEFKESDMPLIDGEQLRKMINKTIYAASKEDNRYIYNGLLFNGDGKEFSITGTDGRRLSTIFINSSVVIDNAVVSVRFLKNLLKNINDDIYIGKAENEIYVKSGNIKYSSRLLEGKFPEYKRIIPETGETIEVNKSDLIQALNQIMIMTESPSFQVILKGNKITTNTPDIGQSEVEMDFTFPFESGMNSTFLMDILKSIESDKIILQMQSSTTPLVFKSDAGYICLCMPMKI